MKAKVLHWKYKDGSDSGIERIYFESHFEQAEIDLKMLQQHSDKKWMLENVSVYGNNNNNSNDVSKENNSIKKNIFPKLKRFSTNEELSEFLLNQRLTIGLSRKDVSLKTNVSQACIERHENGFIKKSLTSKKAYNNISKLLDFYEKNAESDLQKKDVNSSIKKPKKTKKKSNVEEKNDVNSNEQSEFSSYTPKKLGDYLREERIKCSLTINKVSDLINNGINTSFIVRAERGINKKIKGKGLEKILKLVDFYKKYKQDLIKTDTQTKSDYLKSGHYIQIKDKVNYDIDLFKSVKKLGDYLLEQRVKNSLSRKDVERNIGVADSTVEWLERGWVKNALMSNYKNRHKILKLIDYYKSFNEEEKDNILPITESINDELKHRFSNLKYIGEFLFKERMKSRLSISDVVKKLNYKIKPNLIIKLERWRNQTIFISGIKDVNKKILTLIDFYKKINDSIILGKSKSEKKQEIDYTNLSIRTKNALKRMDINNIRELSDRSEKELKTFRGLGYKSICEIKDYLKDNDYSLKNNVDVKKIDGDILDCQIWKFKDELDCYSLGLMSEFTIYTLRDLTELSEKDLENTKFRYRIRAIKTIKLFLGKYNLGLKINNEENA